MQSKLKRKSLFTIFIISGLAIVLTLVALYPTENNHEDSTSENQEKSFDVQKFFKTEGSYAEQIIESCEDDMHCAVNELQKIAKEEKKDIVLGNFAELVSLYERDYPCHQIGHHLGMWLFTYIGEVDQALDRAKMVCGGAIFHGVIQNYLITEHLANTDPNEIDFTVICPKIQSHPYSINRWQCLHGIGHGLTSFYEYDILAALDICEKFDPGWEQISCSKGVFMQNIVFNLETDGGYFDDNDLLFPCNKVDSKWAPPCYHYHSTYILKQNNGEVYSSYADCDGITPKEFVKYCHHGMGRQLEGSVESKIENALLYCSAGQQTAYHSDCFRGMVMTVVNVNTNPDQGFVFCRLLPVEFKGDCYDAMGKWIHMLHPTDSRRTIECLKAENSDYVEICINASLESLKLL